MPCRCPSMVPHLLPSQSVAARPRSPQHEAQERRLGLVSGDIRIARYMRCGRSSPVRTRRRLADEVTSRPHPGGPHFISMVGGRPLLFSVEEKEDGVVAPSSSIVASWRLPTSTRPPPRVPYRSVGLGDGQSVPFGPL